MVRRGNRRGVALIFVLWVLVIFGLAMAELVARARTEGRMAATLRARAVARYAAESGVLAMTSVLQTIVDSASEPEDLAKRTRHLDTLTRSVAAQATGDLRFAVTVVDLNARLDLARSDSMSLRALFAQFVSPDRASLIVAGLHRDPVTRFGELARVPGADDALALAVAPYVTVGSDGLVNINSAPEQVLASLPGIGKAKAHAIVEQRDNGDPYTSADSFRPQSGSQNGVSLQGNLLTISPSRVMIVSRGWQQGSPLTHEIQAVYLILAGNITLLSWEERDR